MMTQAALHSRETWTPFHDTAPVQAGPHRTGATAASMLAALPTIDQSANTNELKAFFQTHVSQESVAVLAQGRPLGLVSKCRFISEYVREGALREVGHLPCTTWMVDDTLIAEQDAPVAEVLARAAQPGCEAFEVGYIIVSQGRYAGMGTGVSLRNARHDLDTETERQRLTFMEFAYPLLQHLHFTSHESLGRSMLDHHVLVRSRDIYGSCSVISRAYEHGTLLGVLGSQRRGAPCVYTNLSALLWLDVALESADASKPEPDLSRLMSRLHRHLAQDFLHCEAPATLLDAGVLKADHTDGLQMGLVWLPRGGRQIRFAGAGMDLRVARPGELDVTVVRGDRARLGNQAQPMEAGWVTRTVPMSALYRCMLFSDGVSAHAGGPFGDPMGEGMLNRFLRSHASLSSRDSGSMFDELISKWNGYKLPASDMAAMLFTAGRQS